jgi:hypothetical protein
MWPLIALRSNNCVLNIMNFIFFFPLKVEKFFPNKKGRNDKNNILSLYLHSESHKECKGSRYHMYKPVTRFVAYLEEHLPKITKNPSGTSQKPRLPARRDFGPNKNACS